ncbi:hypothetical protein EP7_004411 [Isosphaeraceae bacterium EP7]
MNEPAALTPDPDRFFARKTPGSQEWWYFDAISDDGRDAVVIIFYAGCPFDPAYGVPSRKVLRTGRGVAPDPLDHCAVGISWYRPGEPGPPRRWPGQPGAETRAFALNVHRRDDFTQTARPFRVDVAGSVVSRDDEGYLIKVDVPDVDGRRRIRAKLRFRPAAATVPFESELGTPGSPHTWILAAADCRVEGEIVIDGTPPLEFRGRGYHDHNAGAHELSVSVRRWGWGRAHLGDRTCVYYDSMTEDGNHRSLWLSHAGEAQSESSSPAAIIMDEPARSGFGIPFPGLIRISADGAEILVRPRSLVDSGPFYLRWISDWEIREATGEVCRGTGIHELLDTRRLNHFALNWMIPFRLKRPKGAGRAGRID